MGGPVWTEEEEKILEKNWPYKPLTWFDKKLKRRSKGAIREKARRMAKEGRIEFKKNGKEEPSGPLFEALASGKPRNLLQHFQRVTSKKPTLREYQEMRKDGMIRIGLEGIKSPIIATDWSAYATRDIIREFLRWQLEQIWDDLVPKLLLALDFGNSPIEIIYEKRNISLEKKTLKNILAIRHLRAIPPWNVNYLERNGKIVGFRYQNTDFLDEKAIWMTHGKEGDDPRGTSLLDSCYKYWKLGEELYQIMAVFMTSKAEPFLLGHAPPGRINTESGPVDALEYLADVMEDMVDTGFAVLPTQIHEESGKNKWSMDFLTLPGGENPFDRIISFMEQQKLNALLLLGTPGAPYAQIQFAQQLRASRLNVIMAGLSEAINRLVTHLVTLNWGEKERGWVEFGDPGGLNDFAQRVFQFALQYSSAEERKKITDKIDFEDILTKGGIRLKK